MRPESLSRLVRLCAVVRVSHASPEWWLQFYFHVVVRPCVLPPDAELVCFEETPDGSNYTQLGVCDLIYRDSHGRLYIVETKVMDDCWSGRTARTRRNRKRNHLREQLRRYARSFAHHGAPGLEPVLLAMTTDPHNAWMPGPHHRVSNTELAAWAAVQRLARAS